MEWLSSEGGPLVVLPRTKLAGWGGVGLDYDNACDVPGYAGVVYSGGAQALILGDEPLDTAVFAKDGRTFLVRWGHAPDEPTLVGALDTAPERLGEPEERATLRFADGDLVVLDASESGEDAESTLSVTVEPGTYEVRTFVDEPSDELRLVLHELVRTA